MSEKRPHDAEVLTPEARLSQMRQDFAQQYGLDIIPEPMQLDDEQQKSVADSFGSGEELGKDGIRKFDDMHVSRSVLQDFTKLDTDGFSMLHDRSRTEPITVLPAASEQFSQPGTRQDIKGPVVSIRHAHGLKMVEAGLGLPERSLDQLYLPRASANVYSSPHNGAPIITERVTEVPGGTIYEMNLHGAGSPEVIDAQIVVVPNK